MGETAPLSRLATIDNEIDAFEGDQRFMFFLIKTAFWLSLVLLFLPVNRDEAGIAEGPSTFETLAAVQTVWHDVSGFCERNPAACATGAQTVTVIRQKAVYSAGVVQTWLSDDGSAPLPAVTVPAGFYEPHNQTAPDDAMASLIEASDPRIPARDYPPL